MGSKSTRDREILFLFPLTKNSGIGIQGPRGSSDAEPGLRRVPRYPGKSRFSLPARRGGRIPVNGHTAGMEKIQWQLRAGGDRITESWNGLDRKGPKAHLIPVPPCEDIPIIPRFWDSRNREQPQAKHRPWVLQPSSPNSSSHEKGKSWICLLFPIKACFGLGNPGKSHSLFMDCKQLACVMIPKSLGITLDIQID